VPSVLSVLCSNDMTPRQHLESQQALFHQFAKIIDFTLKFDDLKVYYQSLLLVSSQNNSCYFCKLAGNTASEEAISKFMKIIFNQ